VVVCTEGGRIRIRRDKPGPRTAKGRRRYPTDWREPKLLILYEGDAEGRRSRHCAPIIDGTLSGPTHRMALLCHDLSRLGVQQAKQLLFVAEAAARIGKRVDQVIR